MAKQTNMDIKRNPNATAPVFEFMIPSSEFDVDAKVGERGNLTIPVEIVAQSDGMVTFRKVDSISSVGTFRSETSNEMRERLLKSEPITEEE